MLSHSAIWDALDALAIRHGLSASGLARLAGLDATAFNRSKRVSKDGRERWPSTESIAKVLEATGETFSSFIVDGSYQQGNGFQRPRMMLLGFAQAGSGSYFDREGKPAGQGWEEIELPIIGDDSTFAVEVQGDSMVPLYREHDRLIVRRGQDVRRGDRVVVSTLEGEVLAKVLHRETADHYELHSVNPDYPPRMVDKKQVDWVARIIWASQ